ncbi:hypothetical protein KCP74_22565 [Salmonella enterica subsp. enterica]|nr:hypothetical protein KCP74_22565 [Salmonella enterica subsp. enterica]
MARRRAWRRGWLANRAGGVNLSSGKHYPHRKASRVIFIPLRSAPAPFTKQ